MSASSLSDRLKNVEDEIQSMMSLNGSTSRTSYRSTSDTNLSIDRSSSRTSSKASQRTGVGGSRSRASRSKSTAESCKIKDGYQSSRSRTSSESIVGDIKNHLTAQPVILSPPCVGDNILMPSYDSMHDFIQTITSENFIKNNETNLTKMAESLFEVPDYNRSNSAPCSIYGRGAPTRNTSLLLKQLEDEKNKRLAAERTLDDLRSELKGCKQEIKRNKELYNKYCELSEHLEKENQKQAEQLKVIEKTKAEAEVETEISKQKYENIIKDFNMEQEHAWIQQTEIQQLKDCLEQTQLKVQELMGARTMAVELAHDLQKRHQTYVNESQHEVQQLKNKLVDLEKLYNDTIEEKHCIIERMQPLEKISLKYDQLQIEHDELKKKLQESERKIFDITRNPEMLPQVRSLLNSQEQNYKAALTEKATNEMALQAKYTTLEVELQIIQDDYNTKLKELELESEKLFAQQKEKCEEHLAEIEKLKLVVNELTDLSNQYKARISELSDVNKHQEVLIKCQNEAISSKEERVKLCNQEAELNIRRVEQEKKALQLEHEKAINALQKQLEDERDKLRVKDKIADDQAETIMQLKQNLAEKNKEIQKKNKDIYHLDQSVKREKEEKDNLSCDVQHLKMHRVRLNETINELQAKVENLKTNTVPSKIHKKHTQMLEELEKKVAEKQAEWESEVSKLKTERDQARETAQYAIENLSSAMEEYQKELNSQKKLQTNLASLIRDKEEQLTVAEKKIRDLEEDKHMTKSSSTPIKIPVTDKGRYSLPNQQHLRSTIINSNNLLPTACKTQTAMQNIVH